MVNAFATANGVVMGQLKTEAKSNVNSIPALLKLLYIKGCLISIDAMGCQTEIARTIIKQGGDYLLAVKGNQDSLHRTVRQALASTTSAETAPEQVQIATGHGRYEAREYHLLPADILASQFPDWMGLKSIGVAIGYRFEKKSKK